MRGLTRAARRRQARRRCTATRRRASRACLPSPQERSRPRCRTPTASGAPGVRWARQRVPTCHVALCRDSLLSRLSLQEGPRSLIASLLSPSSRTTTHPKVSHSGASAQVLYGSTADAAGHQRRPVLACRPGPRAFEGQRLHRAGSRPAWQPRPLTLRLRPGSRWTAAAPPSTCASRACSRRTAATGARRRWRRAASTLARTARAIPAPVRAAP